MSLVIRRTVTEDFSVDSEAIAKWFTEEVAAAESIDDFLIEKFELLDGSVFGNRFFDDTTNTHVGHEVLEIDDETGDPVERGHSVKA